MVVNLAERRRKKQYALSLRERLAQARRNQGLTQEQIAKQLGYDRSVVSKWENGFLRPHPEDLAELARILNAPDLMNHFCSECPLSIA